MKKRYRKAIFAVIYSQNKKGEIEYLILKRKLHWKGWEFPKGKIERFETKRRAIKREVREETGLEILKIKKLKEKGRYRYSKKLKDRPGYIGQTYNLFAVKVKKGKVFLDQKEHSAHKWVKFEEAIKKLKWNNQKRCMAIVHGWLKGR